MSKIKLRDYQEKAVSDVIEYYDDIAFGGPDNIVIESSVGSGKSLIIAAICQAIPDEPIVIAVSITELIDQIAEHLDLLGLDYSIVKANREAEFDKNHRIQLVMAQTLYARVDKLDLNCSIFIRDEIQIEYETKRSNKILDKLKPELKVGLTGTIYDGTGFMLNNITVIKTIPITELQSKGYLSKVKAMVPRWSEKIDYSKVKSSGSDYNTVSLDEITNKDTFLNMAIDSMNALNAKSKKTIIFCSTIDQAENFTAKLKKNGYEVDLVHSKRNSKENDAVIESFRTGLPIKRIYKKGNQEDSLFEENEDMPICRALVNVMKLTTGFDVKDIALGVTIRPSTSRVLVTQAIGRLVRTHPDKPFAELLDLAGWTRQFGFFTNEYIPPRRTGNKEEDDKAKAELKDEAMPNLDLSLDSEEPEEINLDKYNLIIKELKEKEQAIID